MKVTPAWESYIFEVMNVKRHLMEGDWDDRLMEKQLKSRGKSKKKACFGIQHEPHVCFTTVVTIMFDVLSFGRK